jgi:hypothetical protein
VAARRPLAGIWRSSSPSWPWHHGSTTLTREAEKWVEEKVWEKDKVTWVAMDHSFSQPEEMRGVLSVHRNVMSRFPE